MKMTTSQLLKKKTGYVRKSQYSINLKEYPKHIIGVDVTQIDGNNESLH